VTLGTSLVLAAIGAVLRWAVTAHVSGFNIQTAGLVVFIIGLVGVVLSLFYMLWWTERERASRDPRYANDPRYTQAPPRY
jgi:hypothetical protein